LVNPFIPSGMSRVSPSDSVRVGRSRSVMDDSRVDSECWRVLQGPPPPGSRDGCPTIFPRFSCSLWGTRPACQSDARHSEFRIPNSEFESPCRHCLPPRKGVVGQLPACGRILVADHTEVCQGLELGDQLLAREGVQRWF